MNWLNQIVDELVSRSLGNKKNVDSEIVIETGASPSGTFHIGHIREWVIGDAILLELRRRGQRARLIHFIDDLDAIRKIPANVPPEYEKYLGMPLCDVPAPDGSDRSYGAFFTQGVMDACQALGIDMDFIESHKKYRSGFFVPAIERSLQNMEAVRQALITVSGRSLDEKWSPIQILENGRLKKRSFVSIDTDAKTLIYIDAQGQHQTVAYNTGIVKLDWRLDFPAHWWLQSVACEPSGRDHSTKGGSVDTGNEICRTVYGAEPPLAVAYDFINMVGDTKKMSASKGTGLDAVEGSKILPAEVLRFFILRHPPSKRLYFDPIDGVIQLMDEFAALAAKPEKTESEEQLLYICTRGIDRKTVSRVPFSLLVNSYQAALKDTSKTLQTVQRTAYTAVVTEDAEIIKNELSFIDEWLQRYAPEDIKFSLAASVNTTDFKDNERVFLSSLADKIAQAPQDADGAWFHNAIYEMKDTSGLTPKDMFTILYKAIIAKNSGPRAGWFLSILPRDWLIRRLRLQDAAQLPVELHESNAVNTNITTAKLTDTINFQIDDHIVKAYPGAAVGYLVARVTDVVNTLDDDPIVAAIEHLMAKGVTVETLSAQPEIKAWRAAFQTFGVKPSKFLSSAEALTKRALKGNAAHVNPIVDTYNAVSIKHLVSMGAVDLDTVSGTISLRYGLPGETADLLGMDEPVVVDEKHIVYADDNQIITWLWNHRDAKATAVTNTSRHIVFFADSLLGAQPAQQAIDELATALQKLGLTVVVQGLISAL